LFLKLKQKPLLNRVKIKNQKYYPRPCKVNKEVIQKIFFYVALPVKNVIQGPKHKFF